MFLVRDQVYEKADGFFFGSAACGADGNATDLRSNGSIKPVSSFNSYGR